MTKKLKTSEKGILNNEAAKRLKAFVNLLSLFDQRLYGEGYNKKTGKVTFPALSKTKPQLMLFIERLDFADYQLIGGIELGILSQVKTKFLKNQVLY